MRLAWLKVLYLIGILIASCSIPPRESPGPGISSPTPFQPLTQNVSDSPYAETAPTPVYLPSVTPVPPTPAGELILPESLPEGASVPAFILPTNLNPFTGLPPA